MPGVGLAAPTCWMSHQGRYAIDLMFQPVDEPEPTSSGVLRGCFSCTALCWRLLFCLDDTHSNPEGYGRSPDASGSLLRYQAPLPQTTAGAGHEQASASAAGHEHVGRDNDRTALLPKGARSSSSGVAERAPPLSSHELASQGMPSGTDATGKHGSVALDSSAKGGPDMLLMSELEKARQRVKEKLGSGLSLSDLDDDVCPTCLDPYMEDNPKITTSCNHHFHLACIYEWLERSKTCPMCGRGMEFEELL